MDFALNVALFMPLGAALGSLAPAPFAIAAGAAASVAVETLQGLVIVGRDAALGDVLANTLGTAVGVLLLRSWRTVLAPDAPTARRWLTLGYGVWLAQLAVASWSVEPSPTAVGGYVGQWARLFPSSVPFQGTVVAARIGNVGVPDGAPLPGTRLHAILSERPLRVTVTARGGRRADGTAQIFALNDGAGEVLTWLVQEGCEISFKTRTRAVDLRLAPLSAAVPAPCSQGPTDPLDLAAVVTRRGIEVRMESRAADLRRFVRFTPNMGWTLFLAFPLAFGSIAAASAAWLAALVLPLGFWAGRAAGRERPLAPVAILTAGIGAALLVVPRMAGFDPVSAVEWAAGTGAVAAGWALARPWRRTGPRPDDITD